jgi:hypothetical protein
VEPDRDPHVCPIHKVKVRVIRAVEVGDEALGRGNVLKDLEEKNKANMTLINHKLISIKITSKAKYIYARIWPKIGGRACPRL